MDEALEQGILKPVTPAQEHFLRVCRGEIDPETWYEKAWMRMKGRREYEREQAARQKAQEPPPDYGMVESDIDRPWW